jgi:hypothetical protein
MVLNVLSLLLHLFAALFDLLAPRARLAAENLLLRRQVLILRRTARRPRFKPWERRLLSSLAVRWSALQNAILVVKPATLLRWHRAAWRWWWQRKSKRQPGRPPISPEMRSLIRRIWRENTTWGQTTIAAECGKLGWTVSPRTGAKYRPRHLDRSRGQAWSTFVHNHLSQIWACDFFTIVSSRQRSRRRACSYAEHRSSAASTIATAPASMALRSVDEISAPNRHRRPPLHSSRRRLRVQGDVIVLRNPRSHNHPARLPAHANLNAASDGDQLRTLSCCRRKASSQAISRSLS